MAIATVAGIVGDYKKRQLTLEPLRERGVRSVYSVMETIARGLGTGIAMPLRIRHLWFMLTGAAAATLWALL